MGLQQGPVTLTIAQIVEAMMQWSDNSAANECMDLAGMDRFTSSSAISGFAIPICVAR